LIIKSPDEIIDTLPDQQVNNPRLLIISGPSGSGKTTWCMQLLEQANFKDVSVTGLISPAIFKENQKTGIDLLNIQTGERRPLASRGMTRKGWPGMGPWSFNPEVLKWGNDVLRSISTCQVLIIDEIGPLEFDHHMGLTVAFEVLDSHNFMLTILTLRPSLVPAAMERWPRAEVQSLSGDTETG
jgi:nucleoside-triphosphatase THEP1